MWRAGLRVLIHGGGAIGAWPPPAILLDIFIYVTFISWLKCSGNIRAWPSGTRHWLKAPLRKGVGLNPTAVRRCWFHEHLENGREMQLGAVLHGAPQRKHGHSRGAVLRWSPRRNMEQPAAIERSVVRHGVVLRGSVARGSVQHWCCRAAAQGQTAHAQQWRHGTRRVFPASTRMGWHGHA